jgi:predicted ATP-grasp superfamily ATP-dependent carboligase
MKAFPGQDEQPQPPKAVFTVALLGEFGAPIVTAARSFRDAGIAVAILSVGTGEPELWSSAVSFASYMRLEDAGTPAGLAVIRDFIQQTNAQALLPFWDAQILWLAANQDALPLTCKLLTSSQEALQAVQSKRAQRHVAQRCGFSVLPTWELARRQDVARIDPAAYPVCLRPSLAAEVKPAFKVEVLRSLSALRAFLDCRTWGDEPLLVQPFLPLPSVVVHGARAESGEILVLEAFIAPMKFEGVSLELRPFPLDEHLARCCRKFVDHMGITGPFHFDLLYCPESGSYHYLEINARLGGTTDKVFKLGFDEPLLTLAAYGFDVAVRPYHAAEGRSVLNRRSLLKHMVSVAQGRLSLLDYPVVSPFRHLLLSLRAFFWDKDSIACARDLRGTWLFYRGGPRPVEIAYYPAPQRMARSPQSH